MERAIATFQEVSGIRLDSWKAGKIGEAVNVIMSMDRRSSAAQTLKRELDIAADEYEHRKRQFETFLLECPVDPSSQSIETGAA